MADQQHGYEVPLPALLAAVEEQRNAALAEAAQMKALARHLETELGQALAELEKLRADSDGPFGS